MEERELRTRVAIQALDFSSAFKSVVGHIRIAPAGYVPELMAPDGPSTQGGQHARQRIRLVASASEKYPTLVVGSANVKSGRSELRSYNYVDAVHREHFGRPVELDRAEYEEFLVVVKNYFGVAQMTVEIEESPPAGHAPPRTRRHGSVSRVAIGFTVIAALAAVGVAIYSFSH